MANPALNRQFGGTGSTATLDASAAGAPMVRSTDADDRMSIGGTAAATGILLVILIISGGWGWSISSSTGALPGWSFIVLLGAFILAIVTIFNPKIAVYTSPIYTAAQGMFLGSVSKAYEAEWGGIVLTAVMATVAVFVVMLVLFVTRTITVTKKLRSVIIGATFGIVLFYAASFLLALFGVQMPFVWEGGIGGILFSVFIVGIASLNLLLDFDSIERGVAMGAPKYMNWYGAFGLMTARQSPQLTDPGVRRRRIRERRARDRERPGRRGSRRTRRPCGGTVRRRAVRPRAGPRRAGRMLRSAGSTGRRSPPRSRSPVR